MSTVFPTLCLILSSLQTGDVDLFEKKIRPVLVEHCYSCHSAEAKKERGGLRVDTREALLRGGDSGPALVPGNPKKSILISALHYQDEIKMPPKSKLPANVIADFETWVKGGAADPRVEAVVKGKTKPPTVEEGRQFWSFQPPKPQTPPAVKQKDWARNEIDAFILAGLEAKGLKPAADADPKSLIRRLTFDLIGLPPTPEESDAFEKAAKVDLSAAMEAATDRLMKSPRFGERWGRHWLDIARYGESLTLRGFVLKEAWRYRDYVIDSFNADVPLDRFIREQIAGDLLDLPTVAEKRRSIIGATFLTLGNNNLEEQDGKLLRMDAIDEQLETIGRAFLGQTIGCARCHDHKFDPIPTRDYYALAGILKNSRSLDKSGNIAKWIEVPLPAVKGNEDDVRKHEAEIASIIEQIDKLKVLVAKAPPKEVKAVVPAVAVDSLIGIVVDDSQAMKVGEWKASTFSGPFVGKGYVHDENKGQGEKTLTFEAMLPHSGKYEVRFAYLPGSNRADAVPVTVFSEDGEKTIMVNERVTPPIDGLFVSLGQFRFEKTGQSYVMVSNAGAKGHVTADAVAFIPVEKLAEAAPVKATRPPMGKAKQKKDDADELKSLEAQLKDLQTNGPRREMALGVREEKKMENVRVHIRGSVKNLGEEVPRGFLQAATVGEAPKIPANESGRRQLADWIVDKNNPLTARVMANRLWCWTFGDGLVRTVDNFGSTGERPTHPELLDYLAQRLLDDGWSAKKMIRALVLSRTYRQATSNAAATVDPDNRLWSHMNRRRLDAECIRDAILAVSGQLKLDTPGPAFTNVASDYTFQHKSSNRSVYLAVFRNALPEIFEAFDFADPSVATGKRNTSTVAPQALFMMNNPFVMQQAQQTAKRLLERKDLDDPARVAMAYQLALGRSPNAAESRLAEAFLAEGGTAPSAKQESWSRFVQALFASIEFRFVN